MSQRAVDWLRWTVLAAALALSTSMTVVNVWPTLFVRLTRVAIEARYSFWSW